MREVERARPAEQPALDVDDVGDRLEGDEADSPIGSASVSSGSGMPSPSASRKRADLVDEEAVVLEHAEHAEVDARR